ncbi:unnamed protein product [Closterium sp. Naga37s-1]|nr:unnamed protein product [Closterium sp. Naga37s-1]
MPPRVAEAPSAQQVHARLADLLLLAAHEPSAALTGMQQRVHTAVPTLVALKVGTRVGGARGACMGVCQRKGDRISHTLPCSSACMQAYLAPHGSQGNHSAPSPHSPPSPPHPPPPPPSPPIRLHPPTVFPIAPNQADTLTCSREAEFASADVADCHVIARCMTAGGPASLQRMLARLAAAKPLLPSLRGAKDVPPRPLPSVRTATDTQGAAKGTPVPQQQHGAHAAAAAAACAGSAACLLDSSQLEPQPGRARLEVQAGSGPRTAADAGACCNKHSAEGDASPRAAGGEGQGEGEGVRSGGGDGVQAVGSEKDAAGVSAPDVPRQEGAGPAVMGGGRLVGLGSASDQAAREQSGERVSGSGGGDRSREEVVDGGEGGGLRKGEGEGGVAGEGGAGAEAEWVARGKRANAVGRGGAGGGAVEVVVSASASLTDDVAAVASSSDVASMGSGADVAEARVAVADRAGVRRALMGPAALLAFINDGAEDTAEDASIGAATTGDAQTSISSRLLRLISPPSLLWQSQQPLRKKEGGSSELPHGNKIGEEQRLRLEAWLDDK